MVARELIVDLDDEARRIVWSVVGGSFTPSQRVGAGLRRRPRGSRLVWIADLLPHELAPQIRAMIEHAASVMKPTLERGHHERAALAS